MKLPILLLSLFPTFHYSTLTEPNISAVTKTLFFVVNVKAFSDLLLSKVSQSSKYSTGTASVSNFH
jgi:hypothetical protein